MHGQICPGKPFPKREIRLVQGGSGTEEPMFLFGQTCTGVILEKLKCVLQREIKSPLQTQAGVKEFTCCSPAQPLSMGVMCYMDFQFTVIGAWHFLWRGTTHTLAGLTFPPLRLRVDPSWQKALRGSKGHISPRRVFRDVAVTRTSQNEA